MIVRFSYMNGEFFGTEIGVGENENKFKVVGETYKVYHFSENMFKRIFNDNFVTYIYNKNISLTENDIDISIISIILKHKEEVLKKFLRRKKINNLLK